MTKPTSHEHCLSEPVKQLQGAIDELLGSTPDLFADQFPYFSSADWVKSLATEVSGNNAHLVCHHPHMRSLLDCLNV